MKRRIATLIATNMMKWSFRSNKKKDLNRRMFAMEFSTSTKRLGISMTEKVRDTWRHRWLKLKK